MANIKPAEVSQILKQQLEGFKSEAELEEVGTVLQVGDGIARQADRLRRLADGGRGRGGHGSIGRRRVVLGGSSRGRDRYGDARVS